MSTALEPQLLQLKPHVLPYGRVPLRPDAWDSLMARRAYEDTEERSDRPRALDKNV